MFLVRYVSRDSCKQESHFGELWVWRSVVSPVDLWCRWWESQHAAKQTRVLPAICSGGVGLSTRSGHCITERFFLQPPEASFFRYASFLLPVRGLLWTATFYLFYFILFVIYIFLFKPPQRPSSQFQMFQLDFKSSQEGVSKTVMWHRIHPREIIIYCIPTTFYLSDV